MTETTGWLSGLFPVDDWQQRFDASFPDAINFRIIPTEPSLESIDRVTACITVVGMDGDRPVIAFGDISGNGKTWCFPATVTQVQNHPFPRFEVLPPPEWVCRYWFWPRPVSPAERAEFDFDQLKRGVRETALSCNSGWADGHRADRS